MHVTCDTVMQVSERVHNGYFVDLFVRASNALAIGMCCTHTRTNTHTFTHTHTHTHIYTHIYIYTHTHTHTRRNVHKAGIYGL